jgi:hypothetical protein
VEPNANDPADREAADEIVRDQVVELLVESGEIGEDAGNSRSSECRRTPVGTSRTRVHSSTRMVIRRRRRT